MVHFFWPPEVLSLSTSSARPHPWRFHDGVDVSNDEATPVDSRQFPSVDLFWDDSLNLSQSERQQDDRS